MNPISSRNAGIVDEWGRIVEIINKAFPTMQETHKKIALSILGDAQRVGFSSIQALSRSIGVSEATIIRFAKNIGFTGYADFKKAVQKAIKQQLNPYGEIVGTELAMLGNDKQFEKLAHYEMDNLRNTFRNLNVKTLERMIQGLDGAGRIFLCGFGSTAHVAELYAFLLTSNAGKQIILLAGSIADYIHKLSLFNEKDVLIVVSIPLYAREDIHVVNLVKERGGKIYLFTDSQRCPVYPLADETIVCANKSFHYTNSYVGLIASFKILMDMWLLSNRSEFMARMKRSTDVELKGYKDLDQQGDYPVAKSWLPR
ncbi:MAG TPA: MurR/RpiR family transcriptional regulator [Holophaga sp.]|nr:MurR/RpiR family transcriptional regulator [Holophaga sp.]HPS66880.1 MurR/RpiR family transcriptional regulator [Holophaga sp.]